MTSMPHARSDQPGDSGMLAGPALFGGIVLLLSGPLSILLGVTGIARDHLFFASGYAYRLNLTAWGWIHLIIGVGLVIAGVGVLAEQPWGRWAGVTLAGISLVTQFMFLPYYPAWSIIVMVIDLLIVWSLSRFQVYGERA